MKTATHLIGPLTFTLSAALLLCLDGCRKSDEDRTYKTVLAPKQAAAELEQAFADAAPELKQSARVASQALRNGTYEKAVVSLQSLRNSEGLTLQQGLTVQSSLVALETKLISAIESGDPEAKQAYDLLRQLRRR